MSAQWLKKHLGWVTVAGIISVATGLIAAGEAKESLARDLRDHSERIDKVEPRVDGLERLVPAIKHEVEELHKDVREIRDHLLGPRKPR